MSICLPWLKFQVIQSLIRAIHCTQKEAMDYATIVDREGRSTIKCAMFTTCENIERSIGRITKICPNPWKHSPKISQFLEPSFSSPIDLEKFCETAQGFCDAHMHYCSSNICDADSAMAAGNSWTFRRYWFTCFHHTQNQRSGRPKNYMLWEIPLDFVCNGAGGTLKHIYFKMTAKDPSQGSYTPWKPLNVLKFRYTPV